MKSLSIKVNSKSKFQVLQSTLNLEGNFEGNLIFKKTEKSFKKRYGIELQNAPLVFVQNGFIWKMSFIQSTYSTGRKMEIVDYLPMIEVKDKFKRLERNDIKIY
jgi:CRISPR/Cas system CMR-associated protein Cmr5 small subunit